MPRLKRDESSRSIKDFFKPFTIPKHRIPVNETIEDEIIVASRKPATPPKPISPIKNTSAVPRKSAPKSLRKTKAIAQLDGALEEAELHVSPAASERRVLTAVEVPSPIKLPARIPAPTHRREDVIVCNAATSFSSTSSVGSAFSSIPPSSQSSSKRIVKNGIRAVTNSDSGSVESEEEEELADPSTFVVRKKRKLTPPGDDAAHAIQIPSTVKPPTQRLRLLNNKRPSSGASMQRSPASPLKPTYKHSLSNMVKQQAKEEKTSARLKEMQLAFEDVQRKLEADLARDSKFESGLEAAVADDSDEGERMKQAMERTEALEAEEEFFYLSESDVRAAQPPAWEKLGQPWSTLLSTALSRDQAFLSGFVNELASQKRIPHELSIWLENQLINETREDLCDAYVEVLVSSMTQFHGDSASKTLSLLDYGLRLRTYSSSSRVDDLRAQRPVISHCDTALKSLRRILRLIQLICAVKQFKASSASTLYVELMLLNIDEHVRHDSNLQAAVQDTAEGLLAAIHDDDIRDVTGMVISSFYQKDMLNKSMQCRAVAAMSSLLPRGHEVRRSLALHVFVNRPPEKDRHPEIDVESASWPEMIIKCLRTGPEFIIHESTDYSLLHNFVSILDIAIDSGFSVKADGTNATTKEEQAFNTQIDALISPLKIICSRIRDSGASHLRRIEAKGALERLIARLEYNVRTRPKSRKGFFGAVGEEQRAFLSGFLSGDDKVLDGMEDSRDDVTSVKEHAQSV